MLAGSLSHTPALAASWPLHLCLCPRDLARRVWQGVSSLDVCVSYPNHSQFSVPSRWSRRILHVNDSISHSPSLARSFDADHESRSRRSPGSRGTRCQPPEYVALSLPLLHARHLLTASSTTLAHTAWTGTFRHCDAQFGDETTAVFNDGENVQLLYRRGGCLGQDVCSE